MDIYKNKLVFEEKFIKISCSRKVRFVEEAVVSVYKL